MYSHQAMHQMDKYEFVKLIIIEVNGHCKKKHCTLTPKGDALEVNPLLDSLWVIKFRIYINTRRVYKWKSGVNVHDRQREYRCNYKETHSLMFTWLSIRLILIFLAINQWKTGIVNFRITSIYIQPLSLTFTRNFQRYLRKISSMERRTFWNWSVTYTVINKRYGYGIDT